MKNGVPCSCGCGAQPKHAPEFRVSATKADLSLANLPVGVTATIVKVLPGLRGRKKFADVGLVAGTELKVEAYAPFGGLIRVKFMDTSMALHRDDAAGILLKCGESAE